MNFQSKSLISIILVIICFGLGYFGVLPRWSAYTETRGKLAAVKEQQKTLEEAQKQLNTFLNEFRQHTAEAAMIDNALPLSQTKVYDVLKNLEDLGRSSGMVLGELSVTGSPDQLGAEPNTIQPLDVNFVITGPSTSFIDFLKKIEANLRIIDVTTISLENGESTNSTSTTIKYQVKFRTYFQN